MTPPTSIPPKHIVAACSLIKNDRGEVLMIEHPARGWEFPGGQVDEGETISAALEREIAEETGTQVNVGELVGVYSNLTMGVIIFTYLSQYRSGKLRTSEESLQVEWFAPEEGLAKVTHPAVRARMQDLLNPPEHIIYRAYTIDPYRVLEEHRW